MKFFIIIHIFTISQLVSLNIHASTCYGNANCHACRTCNYCKHCNKEGGTCGVCGGGEKETVDAASNSDTKSNGKGGNSTTTIVLGAGAVGTAYYLGKKSGKKKL